MKKIIIITTIILFGCSVHAQRTAREQTRHVPEKQKSETAVRRPAGKKGLSRDHHDPRIRQATAKDVTHADRIRPGQGKSMPSKSYGTQSNKSDKGNTGRNSGNIHSYNSYKSPQREANNKREPKRTYAYRTPSEKGKAQGNIGQRNNQSVRSNAGSRNQANRTTTEPRRHYTTPNRRIVRTNHVRGTSYHYNPVKFQQVNYHYRTPKRVHVTWTNRMYRDYRIMYPEFRYWYYPVGYQIVTIPFYRAYYNIGEVRNVYGRVHEVYYSWTTDEYHLYFGGNYPYHDFTVIIPGRQARRFDRYPELFFEGRYIWVTGLLSTFEGRPELIVKRNYQIHLY